jgi:hypothetical protein
MSAQALLDELKAMGIRLEPRPNGKLHITPADHLTPELLEAVRRHKTEILATLATSRCTEAYRHADSVPLLSMLVDIADAIASAPRSPFLDDLAIARTAHAIVAVERARRNAPRSIRSEICAITRDRMNRAAEAMRANRYASACDLLDNLRFKIGELKTP